MRSENQIVDLSFQFSVRIVNLYKYLTKTHSEYILSKQVLRSGTSIGANVTEAQDAQSKKDFISKLSIALKEARETHYWLRLLVETEYLPKENRRVISVFEELEVLIKLLVAIVKSTKSSLV
jgi:four helix bundle protein